MIVRMKRFSLIGLDADKHQMLESLMKAGTVEITDVNSDGIDDDFHTLVKPDGNKEEVADLDSRIENIRWAIDYLVRFDARKKAMFATKNVLNSKQYYEILERKDEIEQLAEQASEYDRQMSALKAEENRQQNLIDTLRPWEALDVPLDTEGTKKTIIALGVLPAAADTDNLIRDMEEESPETLIKVVNQDNEQTYLSVIYLKNSAEKAVHILERHGFTRTALKGMKGTVSANIEKATESIREIGGERLGIEISIKELVKKKDILEVIHDHLQIERDRKEATSRLAKTSKVFILHGWIPAVQEARIRERLLRKWDCIVETCDTVDKDHPVLLENNSVVRPFELITELYSLPSSKGIDPNIFMAPFFFVFFGMMLSDAGYGLIMSLITAIVLWKFKPGGSTYKLIKLLFFCGISTFIWGGLFGGWFGNIVDIIADAGSIAKPRFFNPWSFNPIDDPVRLLTWSFVFGAVQLYVGLGIKAYLLIRDGRLLDAIFDVGLWYIFLTGFVLLIAPNEVMAAIGKYSVIGGGIMLVLTQGRKKSGILNKLFTGILSLYNTIGFLSDILSYSRLLALGLATGVIASVINTIGSIFGFNILGIILMVVVFVLGHTFNILINSLGAFVHGSRLQFVEFFSKFYEGGGKAFKPLKINTRYIELNSGEEI